MAKEFRIADSTGLIMQLAISYAVDGVAWDLGNVG